MKVTRRQVIAYRVAAQGLHRDGDAVADLPVWSIGIQDSTSASASLALDARLRTAVTPDLGPGRAFAACWTLRGAPYWHRRADLDRLAGALWPLSDADAAVRLGETGRSLAKLAMSALDAFTLAVGAMADAVAEPSGKGAVSAAMTAALPDVMGRDCRPCRARHISDPTMRLAALPAGMEFDPGTAPPVLVPRQGSVRPDGPDVPALQALIRDFLRLLGPAGPAEAAGYLDARRADIAAVWPDDLVDVDVDGVTGFIPAEAADELAAAAPRPIVRLLGPFDPYMQARDRDLIVPDRAAHKALWPVLGRPGVLFADGEVAGLWRPKTAGKRLTVTVEAFAGLDAETWDEVEAEAQRVGAVRGAGTVAVVRA